MKLSTVLIGIVSLACITEPAWTQTMGDEAELERLRVKAKKRSRATIPKVLP